MLNLFRLVVVLRGGLLNHNALRGFDIFYKRVTVKFSIESNFSRLAVYRLLQSTFTLPNSLSTGIFSLLNRMVTT